METTESVSMAVESGEAKWRRVVAEQRASGLAITVLCKSRGVATSTFFAWRRRLADGGGSGEGARKTPTLRHAIGLLLGY